MGNKGTGTSTFRYGWAETDITPDQPVLIAGQFYARLSEGVMDPITATAWVLEGDGEQAVFISCDLSVISDKLQEAVRVRLQADSIGIDVDKIIMNATHTHAAPQNRDYSSPAVTDNKERGIPGLEAMPVAEYVEFAANRIAKTVRKAWNSRAEGAIAYGAGEAVLGRNRRWVNHRGQATMYRLTPDVRDTFEHMDGYEDHSLHVIATYRPGGKLDGLVINVPAPSQVSEHQFMLSADFWAETRQELRNRFGEGLFVLPQCSAAGDQSPHLIWNKATMERMLGLKGRTLREEIAHRIADAAQDLLPFIQSTAEMQPQLRHAVRRLHLPLDRIKTADVEAAKQQAAEWRIKLEEEKRKLEADPSQYEEARWYVPISRAWGQVNRFERVVRRFEQQQAGVRTLDTPIHVIRLGDLIIATNRFELYVDFGLQIKVRCGDLPHVLLVQLCGEGSYLSTEKSVAAGGYGSTIAGSPIGPNGGRELVGQTVSLIEEVWNSNE